MHNTFFYYHAVFQILISIEFVISICSVLFSHRLSQLIEY